LDTTSNVWTAIIRSGYIGISGSAYSVTAPDATNFYVGNASSYLNSANYSGRVYYWVAIG
jgi:hypothetical protein